MNKRFAFLIFGISLGSLVIFSALMGGNIACSKGGGDFYIKDFACKDLELEVVEVCQWGGQYYQYTPEASNFTIIGVEVGG